MIPSLASYFVRNSVFVTKSHSILETRMTFNVMTPPSWAPTWCYLYFAVAIVTAASVAIALSIGFNKMNGITLFALLFAGTISVIDAMMYFWICRASLGPLV
jgi:hypothetical protein